MRCAGLNVLNPICVVATSIGHLGSTVTNSVFSSVATAFANTADSAINWLWSQMTSATAISFGGASFALDLGIVSAIAAVVCVGLFMVQLATSALKRDGSGIGRALRGLVVATLGCAITLASLDLVLAAVDQLCTGVVRLATGDSIATLGAKIIDPAMFTGLLVGPGAILILSLIAIAAVAVVWFALVVRKMLIIISAVFAPLAFAGGVADVTRGWVRKWLEATLALVFSKLILILIFVIGLGVMGGMGSPQHAVGLSRITGDITGLLILLVAGLSPWMALKLVHFTSEHMATLAGSSTHAASGVSRVVRAPQKVASMRYAALSLGASQRHRGSTPGLASPARPRVPGDAEEMAGSRSQSGGAHVPDATPTHPSTIASGAATRNARGSAAGVVPMSATGADTRAESATESSRGAGAGTHARADGTVTSASHENPPTASPVRDLGTSVPSRKPSGGLPLSSPEQSPPAPVVASARQVTVSPTTTSSPHHVPGNVESGIDGSRIGGSNSGGSSGDDSSPTSSSSPPATPQTQTRPTSLASSPLNISPPITATPIKPTPIKPPRITPSRIAPSRVTPPRGGEDS